jgi:hypothetical protein
MTRANQARPDAHGRTTALQVSPAQDPATLARFG